MAVADTARQRGGFVFGLGEVTVTITHTQGTDSLLPTDSATTTPLRFTSLLIDVHTVTAPTVVNDVAVERIDVDQDQYVVGLDLATADDTGPLEWHAEDSIIRPEFGAYIPSNDTDLILGLSCNATAPAVASAAALCSVEDGARGFERSTPAGGPTDKQGPGRVIHMGGSTSTGTDRQGRPRTSVSLALLHLCVQASAQDLLVDIVRVNQDDYITGGTVPAAWLSFRTNLFGFRGRIVDRTDTLRVQTLSGTSAFNCAGISAIAVG